MTISASVAFSEVAVPRMVPDAEAKSWYGIAELNVAGTRWCNAVLISEIEALTAAHCLFHEVTLHLAEAKDIKLILGQRRNDYAALRGVTDHAVLVGFSPGLGDSADLDQIAFDLALLQLDSPVSIDEILPFEVSDWLANHSVSVTGYGRDRPYLPSAREDCVLTPVSTHVARLGCTVVPGLSGAAVIGETPGNQPRPLVGIVSANLHDPTGMKTGEALVVGIGSRLEVLRALLTKQNQANGCYVRQADLGHFDANSRTGPRVGTHLSMALFARRCLMLVFDGDTTSGSDHEQQFL